MRRAKSTIDFEYDIRSTLQHPPSSEQLIGVNKEVSYLILSLQGIGY